MAGRVQVQEFPVLHSPPQDPEEGQSKTHVLATLVLVLIGGALVALAALTLTGTLIGMSLALPLFIIFSPIIVPAAIAVSLVVAGFVFSGSFGLMGVLLLGNMLKPLISDTDDDTKSEQIVVEQAKRMVSMVAHEETEDAGQSSENKANDGGA